MGQPPNIVMYCIKLKVLIRTITIDHFNGSHSHAVLIPPPTCAYQPFKCSHVCYQIEGLDANNKISPLTSLCVSWSKVLSKPFILMQVFFQNRSRNKPVTVV